MAAASGVGVSSMALVYIAYDYKTCHPFRRMTGYHLSDTWTRFHNSYRPGFTFRTMTLDDLSKYDGSSPERPVYFASDGRVWDVTQSERFQDAYKQWSGKDASFALAKMSMDPNDINKTNWEDLSTEEWKSLECKCTIGKGMM